jgi:CheY-like chemotaxis protein
MPELDGPGVCREVRRQQDESYVYMVLLTSKESKEDIVTASSRVPTTISPSRSTSTNSKRDCAPANASFISKAVLSKRAK